MVFWAAFGGLLGGITLIVLAMVARVWLRRRADEPRLKITARLGSMNDVPDFRGQQLFFIKAANVSRHATTVVEFGYIIGGKKRTRHAYLPSTAAMELGWGLPKDIRYKDTINHFIEVGRLFGFLEKDGKRPSDLRSVYYRDRTGRFHTGRIPKSICQSLDHDFDLLRYT
jgi:hypothetical protein